jgi:hypothetical protein
MSLGNKAGTSPIPNLSKDLNAASIAAAQLQIAV